MYPGVLAVSMRKYVYAVLLLAHTVPLLPTTDGSVNDQYRIEHLRETIAQMELGIEEGADLFGYCPWSAIDLVSTREGITKRYGFVYVDRDEDDEKAATSEMKRYRKDSFAWYQGVIASNGRDLG